MDKLEFASNFTNWIEKNFKRESDLAVILKISKQAVSNWKAGKSFPTLEQIKNLKEAGAPVDSWIFGSVSQGDNSQFGQQIYNKSSASEIEALKKALINAEKLNAIYEKRIEQLEKGT